MFLVALNNIVEYYGGLSDHLFYPLYRTTSLAVIFREGLWGVRLRLGMERGCFWVGGNKA